MLQEDGYGVLQGSVLGPLLFLLYINDIKAVMENSYCHLYADDTILIQSAFDPDSLIESLDGKGAINFFFLYTCLPTSRPEPLQWKVGY